VTEYHRPDSRGDRRRLARAECRELDRVELRVAEKATPVAYLARADFPALVEHWYGRSPISGYPIYHHEWEIHLVRQGSCGYFIESGTYEAAKNSVIVIPRDVVHHCIDHPDSLLRRSTLAVNPSKLRNRRLVSQFVQNTRSGLHVVLSETDATRMGLAIDEIERELRARAEHWQEVVQDSVEMVLILILRSAATCVTRPRKPGAAVEALLDYLEDNFASAAGLAEYAVRLNVSPSSLSRSFKRDVGLGFKQYITLRRIVEAKKMLERTNTKISAIALSCGFDDLSAFYRAFKAITQLTPSAYRKLLISTSADTTVA
jgi:AraC-like DNA-binding protein